MTDAVVVGVGLHKFGKFPDRSISRLARDAIWSAIHDAGIDPRLIDVAYVANCYHGFLPVRMMQSLRSWSGELDSAASQ